MKIKSLIKGDAVTKLSCLVMGLGHIFRGQVVRGFIYLVTQIAFSLYMLTFGGKYIVMFFKNLFTGGITGNTRCAKWLRN